MSNYIAVFFIFPMLVIPFVTIWLCFKHGWLQSVRYLPNNRLLFILLSILAWISCFLIIIMGYDWDHQATIYEQLVAGLGCLVFGFGVIIVFKQWLIKER